MKLNCGSFLVCVLGLIADVSPVSVVRAANFGHFEGRQTHPVALTPNGDRLLALNTPDARLSVFDVSSSAASQPTLIAEIPVGLEPVSVKARTDNEVWVVNEASDTVSIIDLNRLAVVTTLTCPDEPADVIFAQGKAFVSAARSHLIRVFDLTSHAEVESIKLNGHYPRALATDELQQKVYVAFQLSGNNTTVLKASAAPAQPAPLNTNLPAPPRVALMVPATDPRVAYQVLDHDVAQVSAIDQRVERYYSGAGTILFDLGVRPNSQELWVANTEAHNLTRFEPNLKAAIADNRVSRIGVLDGAVTPFDLNPGIGNAILPNPAAQAIALAQPTSLVFSADGQQLWVAAFASDRVARLSVSNAAVLSRVDVRVSSKPGIPSDSRHMRGPRGMALHEGRHRLYVLNKLANSITVIDTVQPAVISEIPVGSHDPTPPDIKEGRGFLFDARLSGNGLASCGTCHIDADRDGLAWDLGDPNGQMVTVMGANFAVHDSQPRPRPMHPMKGPMVTQTLRGIVSGAPFHWRGDRPTLHHFNPSFRDLLGGSLIADADMESLKAYLNSLRHHPNPNRNLDNTLPAAVQDGNPVRGQSLFTIHINHCGVCHVLPTGSDNNVDDLRNFGGLQSMKTPPLQTVYQRALLDTRAGATNVVGFGLTHDGTGGTQALPTLHFYELDELSGKDFADVTAFLLCFETGIKPSVGYNRTFTSLNRTETAALSTLSQVEAQAALGTACDLVVQARLQGVARRFRFDRASLRYVPDQGAGIPSTRDELLSLLQDQDSLTFLATLPGDGPRLGGDRNQNGVLDADEVPPRLELALVGNDVRLGWADPATEWVLERASAIGGPWGPDVRQPSSAAGERSVVHPLGESPQVYFRLRRVW